MTETPKDGKFPAFSSQIAHSGVFATSLWRLSDSLKTQSWTSQYFYLIIHFLGLFSKKITSFICISVQYPFTFYLHFNILMSSFLHFVLCFKWTYCWLCWVLVVEHGLSLAAVSLGCSLVAPSRILTVSGFSRCGAPAPGQVSSAVVEHGLSCPVACGTFLDQGSHLCPLQVDSEPLDHHEVLHYVLPTGFSFSWIVF